jgi:hypothetical protein
VLKRIMFVIAVAAVSAGTAVIGGASAQARSSAHATTTCPPGSSSSAYCEPHCIVPELQGDTITQAFAAIKSADCSLGLIYPAKGSSGSKLLTVVAQAPVAGKVRPARWPVSIGIKL